MDINGTWASVNFPSGVTGFGGTLFSQLKDREFGLSCVRAWNDWLFEEWHGSYPERIVPLASPISPTPSSAPRRSGATRSAASPR